MMLQALDMETVERLSHLGEYVNLTIADHERPVLRSMVHLNVILPYCQRKTIFAIPCLLSLLK